MSVYPIILSQMSFIHRDGLSYPFEERGLQFGDGVYEVIRIYEGRYYLLDEHVNRLFRSAEAIKIKLTFSKDECKKYLLELLKRNGMTNNGKVYLQVTRGSSARNHVFPVGVPANLYAYIEDASRPINQLEEGVSTITHEDIRWDYCYIKSLNLLPNVLAKQEAQEKGSYEAILHKNGHITECSASNVYLIKNEKIYTHPVNKRILLGCVRLKVEQFTKNLNIPFIEESFTLDDLRGADELFLTSSTSEVMPIVSVDGNSIGSGKPGTITRQIQKSYENDAQIYQLAETITNS